MKSGPGRSYRARLIIVAEAVLPWNIVVLGVLIEQPLSGAHGIRENRRPSAGKRKS